MFKRKKLNRWILGSTGALVAAAASSGFCADNTSDKLLDALIKKGILTEKEAQEIASENEATNIGVLPATKWKISDSIKNIGLFGDVRFRYEYRSADNPKAAALTTGDTY